MCACNYFARRGGFSRVSGRRSLIRRNGPDAESLVALGTAREEVVASDLQDPVDGDPFFDEHDGNRIPDRIRHVSVASE